MKLVKSASLSWNTLYTMMTHHSIWFQQSTFLSFLYCHNWKCLIKSLKKRLKRASLRLSFKGPHYHGIHYTLWWLIILYNFIPLPRASGSYKNFFDKTVSFMTYDITPGVNIDDSSFYIIWYLISSKSFDSTFIYFDDSLIKVRLFFFILGYI